MVAFDTIVFDIGGVLVDWDPRHLYRKLFHDTAEMETFLFEVCNDAWMLEQDRGRTLADGAAALKALHPDKADMIDAFGSRWPEMFQGAMAESVAVLADLKGRGMDLYALSNWPAETWPFALESFPFLTWFDGHVVSGQEGIVKPDPRIYRLLFERYEIAPTSAVFIDDKALNVTAAEGAGMYGIRYTGAPALRQTLARLDLLP